MRPAAAEFRMTGKFGTGVLVVGIALAALNLRPALASVGPNSAAIMGDLELGHGVFALMIAIPTICMGIFGVVGVRFAERFGPDRLVMLAMLLIGVSTALRVFAGNHPAILIATALGVGIGISMGQSALPILVKSRFPSRVAVASGAYVFFMNVGAAITAQFVLPLRDGGLGGSWALSLAVWAILAAPALLVWIVIAPGRRPEQASAKAGTWLRSLPWRNKISWLIGLQLAVSSLIYFSVLTWLPAAFQAAGLGEHAAAGTFTVFTIAVIVASFIVPAASQRTGEDRRTWIVAMLAVGCIAFSLLAIVPAWNPILISILLGISAGALFPLAVTLPLDYSHDPRQTGRLTAVSMCVGYLGASLGPLLVGLISEWTGGYQVPLFAIAAVIAATVVVTLRMPNPQAYRASEAEVHNNPDPAHRAIIDS